jgi:transposase InsO family protein
MKSSSSFRLAAMKASIVQQVLSGDCSASSAARSVKVSRKTLYQWIGKYKASGTEGLVAGKTGPKTGKTWNRTSPETEAFVLDLMQRNPDSNIYDLSLMLPQEHRVAPCTIFRIYQRQYRLSVPKRLRRKKPTLYIKESVGQEIQMDCSFPWGYGAKRVSYDCVDDRSRFALARIFDRHTQENAIAFLHHAIVRAPFIIRAVRTDCGSEFGRAFTKACALAGVEHIRNEPYSPEQNGKVEKFHDVYKQRCFYTHLSPQASLDEQNFIVWQWLHWYNHVKTHSGLGMDRRTPAAVVYEYLTKESVTLMLQPNRDC